MFEKLLEKLKGKKMIDNSEKFEEKVTSEEILPEPAPISVKPVTPIEPPVKEPAKKSKKKI